ncbi:response regulator [Sphingomonas sp. MMS24-J13]|uniref:response regulator n=1 Tax=Sphingomonas sp. MMS24-J13 TaxID=3238686 RepID=UPI00384B2FAC
MSGFFNELLSGGYAPHGYCLLWQPELIWTHVIADLLIATAYFSIPLALISLVRRRQDIEFGGVLWLFALFICACGSTHVMAVWNLWHGDYGAEALIKAVTAAASVPTAILLWPLIPKALAIPSPSQLQLANAELAATVRERDRALANLTGEILQRETAEAALVQAQKIEAIGLLTGGIAHDFNNLLQAISGNLDLIRRRSDAPDRVAHWAENAMKGVARGTRLTGQLLSFSRTQRLELKAIDLHQLLAGMGSLIQSSVGPKTELITFLDPQPCVALADQTQLELALLNLTINARDAMPDGGRLIVSTRIVSIERDEDLEPGDYCEIAVADNGAGMSEEVLERALEPFYTTKGLGRGTGLGLSTVFGMARQSGGTLRMTSQPGKGTTVTILLRRAGSADLPADGESEISTIGLPRAPRHGIEVMVVDDDDDVRRVMTETLRGLGYAAPAYASGASALRALRERKPELLVLDFAMPDMDGAEVARQARELQPNLDIIFISGYADSAKLDAVMDDPSALLRKPFDVADLARMIAERLTRGASHGTSIT